LKLSEFIKKLEDVPGSPKFDTASVKLAAELSKKYRGKVVLKYWKAFLRKGENSFEIFNHQLPKDIHKYLKALQKDELFGFSNQEEQFAIELLSEHDEEEILTGWVSWKKEGRESFQRFAQIADNLIHSLGNEIMDNPFEEVLKSVGKSTEGISPEKEKGPGNIPWTFDKKEGWMIGSIPIF